MSDLTWFVVLTSLTETRAEFGAEHGGHNTTLTIAADDWVKLGRPSKLELTPTPVFDGRRS